MTARTAFDVTDRRLSAVILAACGLLVAVGMGRSLLGLASFTSADLLGQVAPWAAHVDPTATPHNPYVGDPIGSIFPSFHEIVTRLWHGDFPSWSSLESGGFELGSVPSFGVLTPIWVPFLVLPLWLAPAYAKLIEIIVAVVGMYLFTRRLGLARSASWFGGFAFATSGFLIAWTNWPQARTAAMIPAVFWALERLVQERTGRNVGIFALTVALLIASGFPSVAAYALYTAVPYVLLRLIVVHGLGARSLEWVRRAITSAGLLIVGGLAGVLLMAVQLLPFAQLLNETYAGTRLQEPDDFLPLVSLVTMLSPDALGTPATHADWLGPRNPIESFSYVGVAVVVLACIGVVAGFRERLTVERFTMRAFFLLAAVGWGVAIYSGGDLLAHLQHLPTISSNAIGRARSIVGFLIAVLAAAGFDALIRRSGDLRAVSPVRLRRRIAERAFAADAIVITAAVIAFGTAGVELIRHADGFASVQDFAADYHRHIAVAASLGGITVIGVGLARWSAKWRFAGLTAVAAVVLVQAATVVTVWWPQVPRSEVYPVTATHDFLADTLGHDRYLPIGEAMLPGTTLQYGLRALTGHAFMRTDFADLIRAIDPDSFVAPTLPEPQLSAAIAACSLLDRLGVRYLVAAPEDRVVGYRQDDGVAGGTVEWSPGTTLRMTIDGGPIRGVGVVLAAPASVRVRTPITAHVLDATGKIIATGSRFIEPGSTAGDLVVAIAGEDLGAAAHTVELTAVGLDTPLTLEGTASGDPALVVVRPTEDGLQLVRAGETTIYERDTALPRIRWAGTSTVDPRTGSTFAMLRNGTAPGVVLAQPGPPAAGSTASVDVLEDSGDTIRAAVDANGAGYLVVADALLDTFHATIDGVAAPLRQADHGYVAIAVPAGSHEIVISYAAPHGVLGPAASGLAAIAVTGLLIANPGGRRRRSGRRSRT